MSDSRRLARFALVACMSSALGAQEPESHPPLELPPIPRFTYLRSAILGLAHPDFTIRHDMAALSDATAEAPEPGVANAEGPLLLRLTHANPRTAKQVRRLSSFERWISTALPKLAGTPLRIRFEETSTRSYDGSFDNVVARREIVVEGPAAAESKTRAALAELALLRDRQVLVTVKVLTRPASADAVASETIVYLDADKTGSGSKDAAPPTDGSEVLTIPRVVTHHGSVASVQMSNPVSYVDSFTLDVGPDGEAILSPQVKVADAGFTLTVTPFVAFANGRISLDLAVVRSAVTLPIPVLKTSVGGQVVEVERPEVATQKWAATQLDLLDGGGALIKGLIWTDPASRESRAVEIIVTARTLSASKTQATVSMFTNQSSPGLLMIDARDREDLRGAKAGDVLEVLRGDAVVGVWTVDHASEGLLVVRQTHGVAPADGDALRIHR